MDIKTNGFVRLVDVLLEYQKTPDVIVEGLYQHGIWSCEYSKSSLVEHSLDQKSNAHSEYAFHALMVVQLFIAEFRDLPFMYKNVEEFEEDHSPRTYGWPIAECPDFVEIKQRLYPPLITLQKILFNGKNKYGVGYADVGIEVERNGIYGYNPFPAFVRFSANSREAQSALCAISVYLADSNSDNPRHELYSPEDDPTYTFGWPEDDFPQFRAPSDEQIPEWVEAFRQIEQRCRKSFFKEDLYTIGRVLATNKATTGEVLTAIEQEGVYGYDRTGRLLFHKPIGIGGLTTTAVDEVESALADFARPILKQGFPDYALFDRDAFALYGWPHDKVPAFKSIVAGLIISDAKPTFNLIDQGMLGEEKNKSLQQVPSGSGKPSNIILSDGSKKGYDLLVLSLLAFINGECPPISSKDPYTKQDDLVATIMKHFGEQHGLKTTSIKSKFGAANKLRAMVGLSPLKAIQKSDHLRKIHKKQEGNPKPLYEVSDVEDVNDAPPDAISGGTF